MEEEKLRELEAAQAETVRKLASAQRAADRAAELQSLSPSLRTYVSENPNADIASLKYMEEQRIKDNLAAQEMRQQLDALREQVTQMRHTLIGEDVLREAGIETTTVKGEGPYTYRRFPEYRSHPYSLRDDIGGSHTLTFQ